jgi:glutathione synthase/RimK-type ligase-like ATP-grasp enzyme
VEKNILCLTAACSQLGIRFDYIDQDHNVVRIALNGAAYYFQLNRTPFNAESVAGICKDKYHTYRLLKDSVRFPKTLSFLSYRVDERYTDYLRYHSAPEIAAVVEAELSYPLIIKSNSGSFGSNVFLCREANEAQTAIETIFDKNSHLYDYVLLAQEFIPTRQEYRLVCYKQTPVLAYTRSGDPPAFNARYWESASSRVALIEQVALIDKLAAFVRPVYGTLDLGFVGFDIVRSVDNRLYLLELNSGPRFDHVIATNGPQPIIDMYKTVLSAWVSEKSAV